MRGLDGLRGLAVLVVVCFHLGEGVLHGGYLGVDVFFVLSGYLITSILLAEHARSGHVDLRRFWVRRARRLMPALLSLMPAVAVYAWVLATPEELAPLRREAIATLAYVANWNAIRTNKSYWQLFAAPSPLEHTCSLAIEEQFYVVWPLLVALALRLLGARRRALACVFVAFALVSALCMVVTFDPEHTARAYFGTDSRAGAILIGAAYAAWPRSLLGPRARDLLGAFALLGLAVACVRLEGQDPWLYHGGFWLTELATLALIGCARAGTSSRVERILALRPLTYLGTISYGVYLWHWPIFCVLTPERVHVAGFALASVRLVVTLLVAVVSFHAFERPIREHGLRVRAPVLAGAGSFALACALVVVATRSRAGVPVAAPDAPRAAVQAALPSSLAAAEANLHLLPPARDLAPGTQRILVLGDSVAQALGIALRAQQTSVSAFVAERGVGDCSIMESRKDLHRGQALGHPDPTHGCAARWVADVAELEPDLTLVVVGGAFMTPMTIDKKKVQACDPGWQEFYRARLHQLADEMGPRAGRLVLATSPAPGPRWRERNTLAWVDCLNGALTTVARERGLATLDLGGYLCPGHDCKLLSSGAPIRPDGLHPAGPGAEELAGWVLLNLRALAASSVDREL